MQAPLKVGLFGVGHLGKIHLQQWKEIPAALLVGFYEPDDETAAAVAEKFGLTRFETIEALLAQCDAADIVTSTTAHYEIARQALLQAKHVFVEKPLAATLDEARELMQLSQESSVKTAVGHVERYNPALLALDGQDLHPMFIESHRLAEYNPRGTDVSVILDLMIHDIDIVLNLVGSPVKRISASGVAVVSDTTDIANARLEFDNGCVANLTASRISLKKMRKMRLFQRDAYISLDFLDKKTEVIRMGDSTAGDETTELEFPIALGNGEQKTISVQHPEIPKVNAIRQELLEFTEAILYDKPVRVSMQAGYQAMDVAQQILKKISGNIQPVED